MTDNPQREPQTFWQLLNTTPLTDLLSGRLTGSLPPDRKLFSGRLFFFTGKYPTPSQILKDSGLPGSIQKSLLQIAQAAGRSRRTQSAKVHDLLQSLRASLRIAPNQPLNDLPVELTNRLSEAIPLRTLDRLPTTQLSLVHTLPLELSQLIETVVSRTRLWKSERIDVARELLNHCEDGLAAGVSPEKILADFGDPLHAAQLIRRSKIRRRPWTWHLRHSLLVGCGLLLLLSFLVYSWLILRFLTATPTIKRDFIAEFDQQTQSIPQGDRAWPLYRAALMKFREDRVMLILQSDRDLLALPTDSPDWETIQTYLQENQQALELTLKGSEKSQFGFIYRDPANREYLEKTNGKGTSESQIASTQGNLTGVLLPHIQDLRKLHRLLVFDAISAARSQDRDRWLRAVNAMQAMAEQLVDGEFGIIQLVSFAYARTTWRHVRWTLQHNPDLLTDQDLKNLAHRVAIFGGGGAISYRIDDSMFFEDLLQRFYTDDGTGNGRLNPHYLLADSSKPDEITATLTGAALSAAVASRAEMRQTLQQIQVLESEEQQRPLWQRNLGEPSPLKQSLVAWQASPWDRVRYLPILKLYQPMVNNLDQWRTSPAGEYATLHRDTTLAVIALALHHRLHKTWPENLDQLTPHLLPSVPLDRFDGKPLKYKLVDGKPILYSVGLNRIDDGGIPPSDPTKGDEAPDGDIRFWPIN